MDTVMDVCSWLLEQGADRDALVLAIGGGVTSDIVGFAAAIYKRGVRSAYIPTTFLAQVDAAIGGKTGVNFNNYKNILGVIRQPEFTYLCPQVLESLPRRDFLSGAAELLKTFIIEDGGYFDRAVQWLRGYALTQTSEDAVEYMRAGMDELSALVKAAADVKIAVVSRDQFEKGERRKLNLGHTFAHAIETLAQRKGYDITHGEAVSMGILMAAELADAYEMRNPDDGLARRLDEAFLSCGLPIGCPFRVSAMADVMRKDKKASAGMVHFVLPFDIGDVRVVDFSVEDVVRLLSVK
jgi:3-dehydroquinate synthetase